MKHRISLLSVHEGTLYFIASVLLLLSGGSTQAQWIQWRASVGGNDHWYQGVHVTSPISWVTASNLANAQGSYLATITSQAEDDFVFRLINKPYLWYGEMGPLLGGFQPPGSPEPTEGWRWVTGEPWGYTHLGSESNLMMRQALARMWCIIGRGTSGMILEGTARYTSAT